MWVYLGIISALFIGFYDISRKYALRENAVLPVLFFSTFFGVLLLVPGMVLSRFVPEFMDGLGLYVPALPWTAHLHLLTKAVIVSASWVFGYFALKHLPLSIVSPIGSSGPVWVLLGAVVFFGERPTMMQYAGLVVMMVSYYVFSIIGGKEGIIFHSNQWVVFAVFATLFGAVSALYDKFLIQTSGYTPFVVQVWSTAYLVPVLGLVVLIFWFRGRENYTPFEWRWSIPLIGFFLIIADFVYFQAIGYEGSLIAILSTLRCSCVVVSFFAGAIMFKDVRIKSKAIALGGVLAGIFLILLSK